MFPLCSFLFSWIYAHTTSGAIPEQSWAKNDGVHLTLIFLSIIQYEEINCWIKKLHSHFVDTLFCFDNKDVLLYQTPFKRLKVLHENYVWISASIKSEIIWSRKQHFIFSLDFFAKLNMNDNSHFIPPIKIKQHFQLRFPLLNRKKNFNASNLALF